MAIATITPGRLPSEGVPWPGGPTNTPPAQGSGTGSTWKPARNWHWHPYDTHTGGKVRIGVLAVHRNGIEKVLFGLNQPGTDQNDLAAWVEVTTREQDPDTKIWGHFVELDVDALPSDGTADGRYEMKAIVYPNAGQPAFVEFDYYYQADQSNTRREYFFGFHCNRGGTLDAETVNASDYGNNIAAAVNAVGEGGTVYLNAGTYTVPTLSGVTTPNDRFITIESAPGVARHLVTITSGGVGGNCFLKWKDISTESTSGHIFQNGQYPDACVVFDGLRHDGLGTSATDSKLTSHSGKWWRSNGGASCQRGLWAMRCYFANTYRPLQADTGRRYCVYNDAGDDAYRDCKANDYGSLYRFGKQFEHSDCWQIFQTEDHGNAQENATSICSAFVCYWCGVQHMWPIVSPYRFDNFATVSCLFWRPPTYTTNSSEYYNGGGYDGWRTTAAGLQLASDHYLWLHCTSYGSVTNLLISANTKGIFHGCSLHGLVFNPDVTGSAHQQDQDISDLHSLNNNALSWQGQDVGLVVELGGFTAGGIGASGAPPPAGSYDPTSSGVYVNPDPAPGDYIAPLPAREPASQNRMTPVTLTTTEIEDLFDVGNPNRYDILLAGLDFTPYAGGPLDLTTTTAAPSGMTWPVDVFGNLRGAVTTSRGAVVSVAELSVTSNETSATITGEALVEATPAELPLVIDLKNLVYDAPGDTLRSSMFYNVQGDGADPVPDTSAAGTAWESFDGGHRLSRLYGTFIKPRIATEGFPTAQANWAQNRADFLAIFNAGWYRWLTQRAGENSANVLVNFTGTPNWLSSQAGDMTVYPATGNDMKAYSQWAPAGNPGDPAWIEWAQVVTDMTASMLEVIPASKLMIEFWNEPAFAKYTLPAGLPGLWRDTYQRFTAMYRVTADAVKAVDEDIRVGGPGVKDYNAGLWNQDDEYPILRRFIDAAHDRIPNDAGWRNESLGTLSGNLTFEFDHTPSVAPTDAVVALGLNPPADPAFDDFAVFVRLNPAGYYDARNGGAYAFDAQVFYSAGVTNRIRIEADITANTYSVWVTPEGGAETQIATNYAFRTSQQGIAALDTLGVWGGVADLHVVQAVAYAGAPGRTAPLDFVDWHSLWVSYGYVDQAATVRSWITSAGGNPDLLEYVVGEWQIGVRNANWSPWGHAIARAIFASAGMDYHSVAAWEDWTPEAPVSDAGWGLFRVGNPDLPKPIYRVHERLDDIGKHNQAAFAALDLTVSADSPLVIVGRTGGSYSILVARQLALDIRIVSDGVPITVIKAVTITQAAGEQPTTFPGGDFTGDKSLGANELLYLELLGVPASTAVTSAAVLDETDVDATPVVDTSNTSGALLDETDLSGTATTTGAVAEVSWDQPWTTPELIQGGPEVESLTLVPIDTDGVALDETLIEAATVTVHGSIPTSGDANDETDVVGDGQIAGSIPTSVTILDETDVEAAIAIVHGSMPTDGTVLDETDVSGLAIVSAGETAGTILDETDVSATAVVVLAPTSGIALDDTDVSAMPSTQTIGTLLGEWLVTADPSITTSGVLLGEWLVEATPFIPQGPQGAAVATAGDLLVTIGDNAETLYV